MSFLWKKYVTPAAIVAIILGLLGAIYNGVASDLKGKADNETIQMYIMQQEKKDTLERDQFQMQQKRDDLKQKELDLKQREMQLKQKEMDTKINIFHPGN